MLVLTFLESLFSSISFGRLTSIPEPCIGAKVISCTVAVVSLSVIVVCSRTPINLSFRVCVVMPWLEWCPDPQQPDAQWVKIFHPGSWTPHEEHDAPPPPHTYREWKESYAPNPDQDGELLNDTEGYRGLQRAIGELLPLKLVMTLILCLFLIITAWPRNPRH